MKKNILFLSFIFFFCSMSYTEEIIIDDVSYDKAGAYEVRMHNLSDAEFTDLKLSLDGVEYKDFTVEKSEADLLLGVILDNSGSMKLDDFFTLLKRMNFILNNTRDNDLLTVWKLNDARNTIHKLGHPDRAFTSTVDKLVREGTYTRLYDAIIDSKKELAGLMSNEEYRKYFPALVILSDADDIKSIHKADDILTDDNNIPVYFFSYLTLPDVKITKPYENLCILTKGKFLERPDEAALKKYLFDRNLRYSVKFKLTKKDFKKNEIITAEIKDANGNTATIPLEKFFDQTNINNQNNQNGDNSQDNQNGIMNFNLPFFNLQLGDLLIPLLILLGLLILFVLFMLLRNRLSFINRPSGKSSGGNKTVISGQTVYNDSGSNKYINDKFDKSSTKDKSVSKESDFQKQDGLSEKTSVTDKKSDEETDADGETVIEKKSELIGMKPIVDTPFSFSKNQKIIYRETGDLLTSKKYDRIHLFHDEKTSFIDEAEKRGQEVYYSVSFTIKKCTAEYLICTGKMFLLLDEIIRIGNVPFKVIAITLDKRKKLLNYKLVPLEKIDLVKKYGKKKEIDISKKSLIYGTPDSIIEKMVSRKPPATVSYSGEWKKAEILSSDEKKVRIISGHPVILDTSIEFKTEVSSLRKISARIIAAESSNREYIFTAELGKP